MKVVLMAALVVLALGCKDEKKEPSVKLPVPEEPPPTENPGIIAPEEAIPGRPDSVTDLHMTLVERLADVAVQAEKVARAHTGDCAATAAALAAITAKSAADVATTEDQLSKLTSADPAADEYIKYRLRLERSRSIEVVALTELCKGSKEVGTAVAGIGPLIGMGGAIAPPDTGWSGARPPGITDEQVTSIDELGAWFGEVAGAAEKAKGDCAAMAKAFQPLVAKGKSIAKRAKDLQKDVPSKTPEDEWLGNYTMQKVDMKRLIVALGKCGRDAAVQKALEPLEP